ncbi:MAG: hypothetical protein M3433_03875 [Actinomycetota bacterium]|nr:hypothetical protein [Actinomycetota bacterium]
METVPDLLREADTRLANGKVELGLAEIIAAAEREESQAAAVDAVSKLLGERADLLKEARREIRRLRGRVDLLGENLAFTADREERRRAIEAQVTTAPLEGLAAWLDEWFLAAADCRTDALRQLAEIRGLPHGAELLVERCQTAAIAIERRDWPLAEPVLTAGADGITMAGRALPDNATRGKLKLLLARLAVANAPADEAETTLRALEKESPPSDVSALRARLARQNGHTEIADGLLIRAREQAPESLDVAIELIEDARQTGLDGIDIARSAVDAVVLRSELEPLLRQLVIEPPAEVWVAVAERALQERDLDLHLLAVEAADVAAQSDRTGQAAVVAAEMRMRSAIDRDVPADEQTQAILNAGVSRALAGQLEAAAGHFEEVLRRDSGNVEASLRLADCRVALGFALPLVDGRLTIAAAVETIQEAARQKEISPELSWAYLVAARGHERLGAATAASAFEHHWQRLVAATRAIINDADAALRWVELAAAANQLRLYVVAHAAVEHAVELDPQDPAVVFQHAAELVNTGHLREALEQLEGNTEPWARAVVGFTLARVGRMIEAANELRSTTVDPEWYWAYETLISALLLTDRFEEARVEAERVKKIWGKRLDESDAREAIAWADMVLGHFDEAHETVTPLAADMHKPSAMSIVGRILILRGRSDEGIDTLTQWLTTAATALELEQWRHIDGPVLRAVAERRGVELPPLDELDRLAEARSAELGGLGGARDAVSELRLASAVGVDASTVDMAKALLGGLLLIIRHARPQAVDVLEPLAHEYPEDPEVSTLLALARASTVDASPGSSAETSAEASAGTGDEPIERLLSVLRELLDSDASVGDAIRQVETEGLPAVAQALESLLADADYRDRAAVALKELRLLQVTLPPSWFAGHEDPVNDHPLFLRYFPEIRLRAASELPPINVDTDPELEPSDFRIVTGGDVDTGTAPTEFAYGSPEAVELLQIDEVEDPMPEPGLTRVPLDAVQAAGPLGPLLTMSALELVARRAGDLADSNEEQAVASRLPGEIGRA